MVEGTSAAAILVIALALDLAFGEPRRGHPVALIGHALAALEQAWNKGSIVQRQRRGALAWLITTATIGMTAVMVERAVASLGATAWMIVLGALALKPTFSLRGLADAGKAVLDPLLADDLPAARKALGRHLVSRDTSDLRGEEISGAAVASLAENMVDSVIAPLLWYAVAGLPGAWIWRTINTADAMWGYRNPRFLHFGRAAARADDLGAWPAARIGAVLISVAALLAGRPLDLSSLKQEAARTPSPNGGWPMGAAALAFGIRLEKRGVYTLNADGRPPDAADLSQTRRMLLVLGVVGALAIAAAMALAR